MGTKELINKIKQEKSQLAREARDAEDAEIIIPIPPDNK
jgi:hypothetical protein